MADTIGSWRMVRKGLRARYTGIRSEAVQPTIFSVSQLQYIDSVMPPLSSGKNNAPHNNAHSPPGLRFPTLSRSRSHHGLTLSVAKGAVQVAFSAAVASGLVELTHGTPTPPFMPSQMTTGGSPQGLVTLKFTKVMLSQMALGLVLQVKRATARPYLPEVVPAKFSKRTLVMFTCEG